MKYKREMRGFKETCLLFFSLLQINLVVGTDYDTNREQAIPLLNSPQNPTNIAPNSCKTNKDHERNTREIANDYPIISNLHSLITQDNNLIKENSNRNVREITDSRIDKKSSDTGSEFDTQGFDTNSELDTKFSNEDTEQQTCIRGNPGRNTRGVSESMGNSNIMNSLKGTCQKEHSKRSVKQVIDTSSSNILNQKVQDDTKQEIGLLEGLDLNKFYEDQISDNHRNIRQILDLRSRTDNEKLSKNHDDTPLNSEKMEISSNLAPDRLDGERFLENNINRNLRDVSDSRQISIRNLEEEESNRRDVRDINSIEQNQNLKNGDSNQAKDNHRLVRGIDEQSPIKPAISKQNLENCKLVVEKIDENQRTAREVLVPLDKEAPMNQAVDFSKQYTLGKTSDEIGVLENLQKFTEKDAFENRENIGENVRNTREIVQDFQIGLNKDFLQDEKKFSGVDKKYLETPSNLASNKDFLQDEKKFSGVDKKYLETPSSLASNLDGILNENIVRNSREIQRLNKMSDLSESDETPSNLASNSDRILNENVVRNSREIQIPSLLESNVFNQNMIENVGENMKNNQIISESEVQRNTREIQDSLLKYSDAFNQNINKNEGEEIIQNFQRAVRETPSNESGNVEMSNERNIREIPDETEMLRANILRETALNSGSNSEKIEDFPENIDPGIFSDDESLVENSNIRSVRAISDKRLIKDESSNLEENREYFEREIDDKNGKFSSNGEISIDGYRDNRGISGLKNKSDLDEFEADEIGETRNIRDIPELSGTLDSKVTEGDNIERDRNTREFSVGNRKPSKVFNQGNIDQSRNIREVAGKSQIVETDDAKEGNIYESRNIRDVSEEFLTLHNASNQEAINNSRNIREIPDENEGFKHDFLSKPLVIDGDSSNQVTINNLRNVREISNENGGFKQDFLNKPSIDGDSSNQETINNLRNVCEISEENVGFKQDFLNKPSIDGDSSNQETINNLRNVREISEENRGLNYEYLNKPLVDDDSSNQETFNDRDRIIREISLKKSNLNSNSINQASITDEARNIRGLSFQNSGFNSDIFKQEPVVIGENRNVREISCENNDEIHENRSDLKKPTVIGGERIVRDSDSRGSDVVETRFSENESEGNEEKEEGIDSKREARTCKKKISHHKNNSSDESIHKKPEPVRASLQMMNLRIVKSKDDTRFSDDATENTGDENGGKRKKKKVCRLKNLHVLQPLKKSSKILESPRRKEENSSTRGTMLKVLKATLDKNEGEEDDEEGGMGEEEDEEKEVEEETMMRNDEGEEKGIDENRAKRKPAKKSKINNSERRKTVNLDRDNINTLKDRGYRLEGRIISSPLVAENIPKRVFGGSKKFVLSENHPQNYVSKNRKSLFKKERLKNDDPTFLVGMEVKKQLKKEDDEDEFNDDFDDDSLNDDMDEPSQSVAVSSGNLERLKLKDLQNFSEPINASNCLNNKQKLSGNKLNNFDKKLRNLDENLNSSHNKIDNFYTNRESRKQNHFDTNSKSRNQNNFDTNRESRNQGNYDTNHESRNQNNFDKNIESDKQETVEEEMEEDEEEEEGGGGEEEGVEEEGSEEEDRGLKKRERDEENGEEESGIENDEFVENEGLEEENDNDQDLTDEEILE